MSVAMYSCAARRRGSAARSFVVLGCAAMLASSAAAQDAEEPAPAAQHGVLGDPVVELEPSAREAPVIEPAAVAPVPTVELDRTTLGWPSSATPPGPSVRPRPVHRQLEGPIVAGVTLFAIGYLGAVVWGSYYFADIPFGDLGCNDGYAGLHLLPFVGPALGLATASECAELHAWEVIVPVFSTAAQLIGALVFGVGLAGWDLTGYDTLTVAFVPDPAGGGRVAVGGRF